MATALDLIKKSMRLIGALGQSEPPTADEASDALATCNTMLESWSIERLFVYQILQENFTWASGQSSRTIGTGGNFNTTRPNKINDGFVRISNRDYPYQVVSKNVYDAVPDKTVQSDYPQIVYYQQLAPLGTLFIYPVPLSSLDFYLNSWKPLQSLSALTTELSMPAGYRRLVEYNLGIELHGEYPDLPLPDSVVLIARQSMAAVKRSNKTPMVSQTEIAHTVGGGVAFDINAGW